MKATILITTLICIVLRLWLWNESKWIPASDQRDYHVLAKNLYDGEGYIQKYEGESPHYSGMIFRAYRIPGYPFIISQWYKFFGVSPKHATLLNILFDLATLYLIIFIASACGSAAMTSAAILWSLNALWSPLLLTESFFTLLFLLLAYCYFALKSESASTRHILFTGIILAIATMTRPIAICMLPLFLYQLRFTYPAWRRSLIALPLIAVIGFWTVRNYETIGTFVPLSTNFGSHNASDFGILKDNRIIQLRSEGYTEGEINSTLSKEIFQKIKDDPQNALKIYLIRVKNLFSLEPVSELRSLLWKDVLSPVAQVYSKSILDSYWIIYLLSSIGLIIGLFIYPLFFKRCIAIIGAFAICHGFMSNGNVRFIAPLMPLFLISTGMVFQAIWIMIPKKIFP